MGTAGLLPTLENYIRSDTPTTAYAGSLVGGAVSGKSSQEYRPIFSFDASEVPSPDALVSAELVIDISSELTAGASRLDKVLDAFTASATWNTSNGISAWSIVGTGGTFSADGLGTDFSQDVSSDLLSAGVKTFNVLSIVRDAVLNESGIVRLGLYLPSIVGVNDTLTIKSESSSPSEGPRLNLKYYTKTPKRRAGRVSSRV